MAKKANYSLTADDNATVLSSAGVIWAEGMERKQVNNSMRAQMVVEKAHLLDNQALTTAGTSTAYTVTTNQSMATPADGDTLSVRWHTTCGATPTLAVDGGTVRTIVHADGSAVAAGDLVADGIAKLTYRLSNTTWYAIGAAYARTGSSTDNAIARFDGTAGKVQDSAVTIADSGALTQTVSDAATNSATTIATLHHATSGTAAAGFGSRVVVTGEDAAGNSQNLALIDFALTDATNGSEDAAVTISTPVAGVDTTGIVIDGAGTDIKGTITNDNAAAGFVGEFLESEILVGSAVSLTSGVPANVTSLSLTAGDWDVWGNVWYNPGGTISMVDAVIHTTSATLPTLPGKGAFSRIQATLTAGGSQGLSAGQLRLSLSSTTTVYLIANAVFGTSMGAYGYLAARRAR